MCNSIYGKDLSLWMNLWFRGSTAIVLWYCSYLYLELLSGSSRYQRLVACILGYFLLPLNLLYSNSVFSGLRGFPHSHVSVRVLPVGISVSHWHPRDLATTAALCTCCTIVSILVKWATKQQLATKTNRKDSEKTPYDRGLHMTKRSSSEIYSS